MAKPQTIDDLFPTGDAPGAAPLTAKEIEDASKPAFYPKAGSKAAAPESAMDTLFPTGGPPEPTAGDMTTSIAKGAAKGALRDAPLVGGALAGFRTGMPLGLAAAPTLGPFAAAIPLATTVLGGYLGYEAGQSASGVIPGETDPRLKPYFEGGTTFGSAISTAPAAFYLPTAGPTAGRVATFLSNMGKNARSSPKVFMGAETAGATLQGIAGGAAEAWYPGQEGVRLGAEVAAGLTPMKLLTSGVDASKSALNAIKSGFSNRNASLEAKAANLLLEALEKSGDDPEKLIKALRQKMPTSVPSPTSGQKTGNQVLMDLESSLGGKNAEFGGKAAEQGRLALLAYQELVEALGKTGPEGLIAASKLRYDRFTKGLETRLAQADFNAAKKIAKITKDTPDARRQIGQIVKDETEFALTQARDVESQLWTAAIQDMTRPVEQKVRRQVETGWNQFTDRPITRTFDEVVRKAPSIKPSATVETFLDRASEMGPALFDSIPAEVRRIMGSFGITQDNVAKFRAGKLTDQYLETGKVPTTSMPQLRDQPVQDLVSYRSTLLKMAREAAADGKNSNASFYSSLADGMIKDLDQIKDPMFDQAREFSRALNDTFTRTYANELTRVSRTGKDRIPAETLVQTAFGGSGVQTAQRMKEIEDAVTFIRTQYRDIVSKFGKDSPQALQLKPLAVAATDNVASVQEAHNRVLRLAAAKALKVKFDDKTQSYVNDLRFDKLTEFARENADLLNKMGIMGDLRDAAHAANLLTQVTKETSALSKAADSQRAFAKVLSAESPIKVISESLTGRYPVRDIRALAELAKKGGPDAVEGLKSSLYDYAYTKAGGNDPKKAFSIDAYTAALFDPISRNQPSIANIMRANGMLSLQELSNFKKLLVPMARIETALKNNIPVEDVIQGADAVTELGLRIIGARIGTAAAPGGPGSLIAASAGSKAVRQIFDALPNATVRQILENAVKDPEAMALLLAKGKTEKEKRDIANGLINFFGTLGVSVGKSAVTPALNYLDTREDNPSQVAPFTQQGLAARQLRQLPVAPSTRGVPGLTDLAPKPPGGPGKGPGGPASPDSRAMYQSLFPYDTVSPMAGAQPPKQ